MNDDYVYFALEEIFSQLNCSWFIQKPVRELLFEGYDDPLMKIAKTFMNLPYDKFGWFYKVTQFQCFLEDNVKNVLLIKTVTI